jgi:hypothetical protein
MFDQTAAAESLGRRTHQFRSNVRFSNRPVGVKHFQTVQRCSFDVARGLASLRTGTKALPSWVSRMGWNNLLVGLAVRLTAGPSGHANSPHPSSRERHHSAIGQLGLPLTDNAHFAVLKLFTCFAQASSRVHLRAIAAKFQVGQSPADFRRPWCRSA